MRPTVCALSFLLLALLPPSARAGHYAGPTYSGGTATSQGGTPTPDNGAQGGWGGGGGTAYGGHASGTGSCDGQIKATLTWTHDSGQTDQNDPPPTVELVQESCDTKWTTNQTSPVSGDTVTGTFGNPFWSGPAPPAGLGGDESGVKYSVQGGATISTSETVTCSVTGSGSAGSVYSAVASVNYGVTAVSPITINLTGAIQDSSGNCNILVGQKCTATLGGIPTALQPYTTYAWKVSGTTFESWGVVSDPNNQSHTSEVDGPIPATNPTQWYWNDLKQTPETVTCTATVTPPAGQGAAFPITVTQKVTVYVPGWNATGTGGYMQVNTKAPRFGGTFALWAGPSSGQAGGMNWSATSTTPPIFGAGTIEIVQTVTPSQSYITNSMPGVQHNDPENGLFGLDTIYPYPGPTYAEGNTYLTNDNPALGLASTTGSATMQHSFTDYLMYEPPNSTQYVPLGTFAWSTNGKASIVNGTGGWPSYVTQNGSDAVGTVTPTASTLFTAGNTFPAWTRINVFPAF